MQRTVSPIPRPPLAPLAMALPLLIMLIRTAMAAPIEIRLHYVGAREEAAFLGVTQGLEEANLQGRFLGQRYVLDVEDAQARPTAILAALEEEALVAVAGRHPGIPVFNLSSDTDALRAKCLANLLHVIPSREMKRDALAQWRKLHPDSEARAQAWHPEFKKYSAEQLSKRFFKARGQAMDDGAWAGWAAVKLLSDSVARLDAAEPESLLDYIKTRLAFDGQKGIDMNFRPNGQLRQPLLLVEGGKIVGEAPVKGVVDIEDLDSLGSSTCPQPDSR
ncbi:MAG: ABC transporter substrate-binding protein [Gammaproteobacteria bacterium]